MGSQAEWCKLGISPSHPKNPISTEEYVLGKFIPLSRLTHDWEFHSDVTLSPAEERTIVREPVQAIPAAMAQRLGKVRILAVAYIACLDSGDMVTRQKPSSEAHTAAWVETPERINLLLACRELDAHDTGFELLGSTAELLRPRLTPSELAAYNQLLEEEIRHGARGEIDEDALTAKQIYMPARGGRRSRAQFERYRDVSFVSTAAEYIHGLWHDVQIRIGPEHLPVAQLRRRMNLMAELFPPNEGYRVFDENVDKAEDTAGEDAKEKAE